VTPAHRAPTLHSPLPAAGRHITRDHPGDTMLTTQFWKDAAERAVKTAAQAAIGAIGTTALIQSIDWSIVGGTVGIATVLSVLSSIGSSAVAEPDSASLVRGQ
jgi:hypothetical protein